MKHFSCALLVVLSLSLTSMGSVASANHVRPSSRPPCTQTPLPLVNNSDLTLENCSISGSSVDNGDGAAIDNSGNLKLINVTITNNSNTNGFGGGIYNEGTVVGHNVNFVGNKAAKGDGGAVYNDGGTATFKNSRFTSNSASEGNGGALYNSSGTVTLKGSTFSGNSANGGDGGAIFNNSTMIIKGIKEHAAITTISDNTATGGSGGGIYSMSGTVEIVDTVISGNKARDGAGTYIEAGTEEAQDTSIIKNLAGHNGGGIYLASETAFFCCGELDGANRFSANITIAKNRAGQDGGGIYNDGGGVQLGMATVSDNTASNGAGGISDGQSLGQIELKGVLLARNSPVNCAFVSTALTDDGFNLDTGTSCQFTGAPGGTDVTDIGDSNARLGTLKKGKFLWGEHPTQDSPAIDAIPTSECNTSNDTDSALLASDQFDIPRPQGPACDIGAVERRVATD